MTDGHRTRFVRARRLMDAPAGLEQAGDELHDPDNWTECLDCRVDVPVDMADCWQCNTPVDHAGDAR